MKTMILITLMGCLVLFFSCCSTLYPDEKLTLQRIDYQGNKLRTDGYYYFQEPNRTSIHFLYKNGIILYAYSYPTNDLNIVEKEMINYIYLNKSKDHWGVFLVDSNVIQYERWIEAPSGVSVCFYRCSGYIENDSTLHFMESYYSGRNETKQIDEVWHFKQFENKPDSTNTYIK
ncbi:MAG: hypothetical protein LBT48_08805 [Prevotellaceae bacterium]|jgi:hypothetical protein|nr:hypothetical protein [Prevotellaceae bacterium]